jgi:hypothetical protein
MATKPLKYSIKYSKKEKNVLQGTTVPGQTVSSVRVGLAVINKSSVSLSFPCDKTIASKPARKMKIFIVLH